MRRLWLFLIQLMKVAFVGVAGLVLLFVALGLSGALDKPAEPPRSDAVPPAPKQATAPAKAPQDKGSAALFSPEYAFADSPHVMIWRDQAAMDAGIKLIGSGVGKTRPDLVLENVACLPDSGTQITVLDGGFFSSNVIVVDGGNAGCRGLISNTFISKSRTEMRR